MTDRFSFATYASEGDTSTAAIDGFVVTATIYRDDTPDTPEDRDDGFWPTRADCDSEAAFEKAMDAASATLQAWKDDEWFFCGVAVTVALPSGVRLTGRYDHALWGVECNYPGSNNSYLGEVADELADEALAAARLKVAAIVEELTALTA